MVHMKKTFQCATCNQRFSTPNARAYHAKTCGTRFECPVCGRKYKAKKFLNQHARRSGHDVLTRFGIHLLFFMENFWLLECFSLH